MSAFYELPKVAAPEWHGIEREIVAVGGYTYCVDNAEYLDVAINDQAKELARWLAARDFAKAEAEKSRLDCAGERAFIADRAFHENTPLDYRSWDELRKSECAYWVAVAKAVLDGEH